MRYELIPVADDMGLTDRLSAIRSLRDNRADVVKALRPFPDQVNGTRERLDTLNPEFVADTIEQLMILPGYLDMAASSLEQAKDVLDEVLSRV